MAAFLMVSCEGKTGTEQPSLEVSPETMTFEAGSGTQQAAVPAQGVEWTHEVAVEAAEWLSAERSDGKTLTVTEAENPAPAPRSGRGLRRYAVRDNRLAAGGGCRIRTDARTGESRVRG